MKNPKKQVQNNLTGRVEKKKEKSKDMNTNKSLKMK
jgi:hypothetical protein